MSNELKKELDLLETYFKNSTNTYFASKIGLIRSLIKIEVINAKLETIDAKINAKLETITKL